MPYAGFTGRVSGQELSKSSIDLFSTGCLNSPAISFNGTSTNLLLCKWGCGTVSVGVLMISELKNRMSMSMIRASHFCFLILPNFVSIL